MDGLDVLEVGSGAGQCSRWVRTHGGRGFGLDLSHRQLQHSLRLDEETGVRVPSVRGTATDLPFAPQAFDIVFCSFGALQFISDIEQAVAEVARVLRPGGRFAFSITHPTRWMFPDDPGDAGLTATQSYWDRTPYVEVDDASGEVSYVEHHRTLGDWVRLLAGHGFTLDDLVEPEWPEQLDRVWGGWSRHAWPADARHGDLRGAHARLTDGCRGPARHERGRVEARPPSTSPLRLCDHPASLLLAGVPEARGRPPPGGGAGAKTAASAQRARSRPDARLRRLGRAAPPLRAPASRGRGRRRAPLATR